MKLVGDHAPFDWVVSLGYRRTGMTTRPNASEPVQIELGIDPVATAQVIDYGALKFTVNDSVPAKLVGPVVLPESLPTA